MGKRRLVVVDLDGTLVQGNTLHEFLRLGLMQNIRQGKIIRMLNMIWLILLRSIKLISHTEFKYRTLGQIEITDSIQQAFKVKISSMLNRDVEQMIKDFYNDGANLLLATAAPETYISWIWDGNYIASDPITRHELRGEEKLKGVKDYLLKNDLELYAVITDHYDDLPLLQAGANHNILINPSLKTIERTGLRPYTFAKKIE